MMKSRSDSARYNEIKAVGSVLWAVVDIHQSGPARGLRLFDPPRSIIAILIAILFSLGGAARAEEPSDDDGPTLINPNGAASPRGAAPRPGDSPRPFPAFPSFEPSPGGDSNTNDPFPEDGSLKPARPRFPRDPFAPPLNPPRIAPDEPRGVGAFSPPLAPDADDFTAASLRRCQVALRRRFGETDRDIPPAVKAEFLQWVLTRYHRAPYRLVHHSVNLPDQPGLPPEYTFGDDVSTWNGALLAAMSYKYAVTREPETLALICDLVRALNFCQKVTGRRGLPARCVLHSDKPVLKANRRYVSPEGDVFHYRSDAAKGTVNQIACGYAVMLMLVGEDLPVEIRSMARHDLAEIATHLLDHDYRLTEADGKKTSYGDLTPLLGPISVPFNAQVAYMIVAASYHFPGPDVIAYKMIKREFKRLRGEHHVYFEDPRKVAITPQQAASGPLVKGMNDRNHVMNAAYVGLLLEIDLARRVNGRADREFLFELGQTVAWAIQEIQAERNALCNFMWAGLLRDPFVFESIVPAASRPAALRQLDRLVGDGVEQIRRARIDRFYHPGQKVKTRDPQWVDVQRPDEIYCWKAGAMYRWEANGPPTNTVTCGIDYLHAYWLMRYYRLAEE